MGIHVNTQTYGANVDGVSACISVSVTFPILNGFSDAITLVRYHLREFFPKGLLSIFDFQFLYL